MRAVSELRADRVQLSGYAAALPGISLQGIGLRLVTDRNSNRHYSASTKLHYACSHLSQMWWHCKQLAALRFFTATLRVVIRNFSHELPQYTLGLSPSLRLPGTVLYLCRLQRCHGSHQVFLG